MKSSRENLIPQNRKVQAVAGLVAAVLAGAALAGWLDHGAEIFLSMASDAWAMCF